MTSEKDFKQDEEVEEEKKTSAKTVFMQLFRIVRVLALLYFFICSLDLLSNAFRLIGGKAAGALSESKVFTNPIAALMVGILLTVLVQSSSTSTSIIITMVAANMLSTNQASYMVMGANIGTSVTNTLVALGQVTDRQQFRRAFSGATVHDVFNWLSVLILLPLEMASGYLARLTGAIVTAMNLNQYKEAKKDLLKTITKPLTKLVIQLDSGVVTNPKKALTAETLMKYCCVKPKNGSSDSNGTAPACIERCRFMFINVVKVWPDYVVGIILLILSLAILIFCLIFLVQTLNALLQNSVSKSVKKFVNSKRFGVITDYLAILVGAALTILVQSSSVFTSALTPLVGNGFIELERMFPLTLGSNIGTTVTGILAALASDSDTLKQSMQTAMTHLFFNISGIVIWFPLPFMRKIPLAIARRLGKTTSRYRWFAIVYILWMFFLFPLLVFALSLTGTWVPAAVFVLLFALLFLFVGIVTLIQRKRPQCLPMKMRTWKWLPLALRSLEPYDRLLMKMRCRCGGRCDADKNEDETLNEKDNAFDKGIDNLAASNNYIHTQSAMTAI